MEDLSSPPIERSSDPPDSRRFPMPKAPADKPPRATASNSKAEANLETEEAGDHLLDVTA